MTQSAAYIVGASNRGLWGMTGRERAARLAGRLGLTIVNRTEAEGLGDGPLLLLRADAVLDEALVQALVGHPGGCLVFPAEQGVTPLALSADPQSLGVAADLLESSAVPAAEIQGAGFEVLQPNDLTGVFNKALRKRAAPFAFLLTESNRVEIEKATFEAAYKGVTDFVTKFVWPWPAFMATRYLAPLQVTPNMVTTVSCVFSVLVFLLFLEGHYLSGIFCGWVMAFLDTVDGKLARVTLSSSKWGNVFDHGIDLVAPPLWWLAWWLGLPGHEAGLLYGLVWIVLGGHIAGKLVEQAFISTFGLKTHVWQRLDSNFRLITARRNPNLAILMVLTIAGSPAIAYGAMGLWILCSLAFHGARYARALAMRRDGAAIHSWLES